MIDSHEVHRRLQAAFPDGQVEVKDLTGGGDHYQVTVISQQFSGVPPLKRHRMVYAPLKDVLGGALHALALSTRTPDEATAA